MQVVELSDRDEPWSTHRLQILFLVGSMKDWKTFAYLRPQLDARGISRIMRTGSFPVGNQ